MEKVAIFGLLDVEMEATGTGSISLSTDMPGNAMAVRETATIAASSWRTLRFRLAGTTKGHSYKLKITPTSGTIRLYAAKIWGRVLPDGAWSWWPVPIIDTPVEFTPVSLPIPPTPEEWTARALPIPATTEEWTARQLSIPPTPEEWAQVSLPIKPTPIIPEWINVEIDR